MHKSKGFTLIELVVCTLIYFFQFLVNYTYFFQLPEKRIL